MKRLALLLFVPFALSAQDTTQAYPWRLSYFPYITASPNDGLMVLGRAVLFRQSRWDDRVSLHSSVAIEGGYSTKDAWVARVRGDFPRIADGWRLHAIAEASRTNLAELAAFGYPAEAQYVSAWQRQSVAVEVTRTVVGRLAIALRGDATRIQTVYDRQQDLFPAQNDMRGRAALVLDLRDREYDTRKGVLLQGGFIAGTAGGNYHGVYALAAGWLPAGEATRFTARAGFRTLTEWTSGPPEDAWRTMPAWEDEFTVGGGAHSDRAVPPAYLGGRRVMLAGAEVRHDLKVFPGGALAVLAFVDAARVSSESVTFTSPPAPPEDWRSGPAQDWVIGPGVGVAIRLLRNAVLTTTVARAQSATRVYVSSGWSW